ncbi:MAG TPA: tRNA pseudouridine(38-40) synthase TruA [Candidatus Competibacteraceae bacterium]|nr:tRNA pseudouridine(38-40) synthase TruA [Candidatus Competibacteraceae bacterium]
MSESSPPLMRIALGVEYDGTAFHGWQSQSGGVRTVQDCLELALSRIADHSVHVACAGRTDAGVHALAQVVHFDTTARRPERAWVMGGNTHLPGDVRILWARPVAADFHARFSALARSYRYLILNAPQRSALMRHRASWHYRPLDVERMALAARDLLGEHDFSAFRGIDCQAKSPVRTVYRLELARHGDYVLLEAEANAFLHHMVRNLAGVLMAIGEGSRPVKWARQVLESRDRCQGGITAPPQGLYLSGVRYLPHYGLPAAAAPLCLL